MIRVNVLDTTQDRTRFTASLAGKRVLHVKGFGSTFKDPTDEQKAKDKAQQEESAQTIRRFRPDFIVVDGDGWGTGFQQHIKAFYDIVSANDDQDECNLCGSGTQRPSQPSGLPEFIWAKNIAVSEDGAPSNPEEKGRRVAQAEQWAQNIPAQVVHVYWIDQALLDKKVDNLFGEGTVEKMGSKKFNARGHIQIQSGDEKHPWVSGVSEELLRTIRTIEHEDRNDVRHFEKCSFENAAKGNLIFESLENPETIAHGIAVVGGGESVVLELSTKYLNSTSGFDDKNAAVLPHSRGKEDIDPILPKHVGAAFKDEVATPKGKKAPCAIM